jgi:hypothetical protein
MDKDWESGLCGRTYPEEAAPVVVQDAAVEELQLEHGHVQHGVRHEPRAPPVDLVLCEVKPRHESGVATECWKRTATNLEDVAGGGQLADVGRGRQEHGQAELHAWTAPVRRVRRQRPEAVTWKRTHAA